MQIDYSNIPQEATLADGHSDLDYDPMSDPDYLEMQHEFDSAWLDELRRISGIKRQLSHRINWAREGF